MRLCHRAVVFGLASAGVLLATATPAGAATRGIENANALVLAAQVALQRSDCGRASASYVEAAERLADVRLAAHAADVALACGQFTVAVRAVKRWQALAPGNAAALHAQVRAELGLYRIDSARTAFQRWITAIGPAAGAADSAMAGEIAQLVQQAGATATFALLRGSKQAALSGRAAQLALAGLAFDDWNYHAALQYARAAQALPAGAASASQRAAVDALIAHADAGLGDADAAIAVAKAAHAASPGEQSFVLPDVLQVLGREADARAALEALRNDPQLSTQALRRLGLMAFDRGDYSGAEQIFNGLLTDRGSSTVAVFYLGSIAERRSEMDVALRAYRLLDGTSLEAQAHARIARILYRQNQHDAALKVLRAGAGADVAQRLAADVAQAQLLSDMGAGNEALARIDDALLRFPGDSDLRYQQAVLLERAGRTAAAISTLATLARERPLDPTIGNALGFTLADHDRELARAQKLIGAALLDEPDNPAILDSAGWLQFKRGAPQTALPLLARAFRLGHDGDIGAHWGQVLWALGSKTQARAVWNRALIADPDNDAVKTALKRAGVPAPIVTGTGESI